MKTVENQTKLYDFSILRHLRQRENMSIGALSKRSSVSPAVISKLERNKTLPDLDTLCRLGRVFGMNPSDFLSISETRAAHRAGETAHKAGGFSFREVTYGNVKCLLGKGAAGSRLSRPEVHRDDYEICWVLGGHLRFTLPFETQELRAGESIQFDALLEHTYEAVKDSEIMIIHVRKDKRF